MELGPSANTLDSLKSLIQSEHLMIREDYGGPDAPFDGKENVIEGIFEKLKAVNSELITSAG